MALGLHLWYQALGSAVGVIIETNDPDRCKQRLYAMRQDAQDPDLEEVSIVQSPSDPNHLWLVRNEKKRKETP